jgi:hypothetical protein
LRLFVSRFSASLNGVVLSHDRQEPKRDKQKIRNREEERRNSTDIGAKWIMMMYR